MQLGVCLPRACCRFPHFARAACVKICRARASNFNAQLKAATTQEHDGVGVSQTASMGVVAQNMLSGTRLTSVAQDIWTAYVQAGDSVVDATAGNGGDTLWLAKAVGPQGSVYAFDKEELALAATKAKLEAELQHGELPELHLEHCCHSTLDDVVKPHSASLICFNLGYLPSAEDKSRTATQQHTTVAAVAAALNVVNSRGLISIMAYIGHAGGQEEYEAVRQRLEDLSPTKWTVSEHKYINRPAAPVLMCVAAKDAMSK